MLGKYLIALTLGLTAVSAFAGTTCTDQPKEKWQKPENFRASLEQSGYKIQRFKIDDSCYEIYGTDTEGKKVEIYFDPVTGKEVKSKRK
jgi:hypothetical protein